MRSSRMRILSLLVLSSVLLSGCGTKMYELEPEEEALIASYSAKVVAKKRQEEEIAKKMSHMIPGNVYEGVVDSIQSYGAFINLGDGLSGLLHISRISQKRLNSPSEVLKVGQKVQVKLLDNKDGKLSLSMKEFEELTQPVETDEIEVMEYKEEEISTSLGSLLGSIKLQ